MASVIFTTSATVPLPLTVGGELLFPALPLSVPLAVQPVMLDPPNPVIAANADAAPPHAITAASASVDEAEPPRRREQEADVYRIFLPFVLSP